jgi:hypothetical protein
MLRTVSACILLLVVLPASASAEWHFTPMIGWTFKGGTNIQDTELAADKTHKQLGGAVSVFGEGVLGAEAIVIWTPSLFQGEENLDVGPGSPPRCVNCVDPGRSISLMGNVVVTVPRRWTEYFLRPYFSGGIGLIHARVQQVDVSGGPVLDPVNLDTLGYNLGGGAIGFFTDRTGVRVDFRYHSTFRRSDDIPPVVDADVAHLRYMTFAVGVVIRRR